MPVVHFREVLQIVIGSPRRHRKYRCAIRGCRCLARSFKIERRTQIAPRSTSEVAFRVLTLKTNGIWHNSTMPTLTNICHEIFANELSKGKTADEAYELAGYVRNSIEGRRKDQERASPSFWNKARNAR